MAPPSDTTGPWSVKNLAVVSHNDGARLSAFRSWAGLLPRMVSEELEKNANYVKGRMGVSSKLDNENFFDAQRTRLADILESLSVLKAANQGGSYGELESKQLGSMLQCVLETLWLANGFAHIRQYRKSLVLGQFCLEIVDLLAERHSPQAVPIEVELRADALASIQDSDIACFASLTGPADPTAAIEATVVTLFRVMRPPPDRHETLCWQDVSGLLGKELLGLVEEMAHIRPNLLPIEGRAALLKYCQDPANVPTEDETNGIFTGRISRWLHALQIEILLEGTNPNPVLFWQLLCRAQLAEATLHFKKYDEARTLLVEATRLAGWGGSMAGAKEAIICGSCRVSFGKLCLAASEQAVKEEADPSVCLKEAQKHVTIGTQMLDAFIWEGSDKKEDRDCQALLQASAHQTRGLIDIRQGKLGDGLGWLTKSKEVVEQNCELLHASDGARSLIGLQEYIEQTNTLLI